MFVKLEGYKNLTTLIRVTHKSNSQDFHELLKGI